MKHPALPRCALVGALALFGLAGFGGPTLAQEATPQAGAAAPARETPARPVHIHDGSCDELGEVVYPLTPIEVPQGQPVGAFDEAVLAGVSYTPLEVPLEEILDGEYAINAHFSEERIGDYIACGDVGGVLTDNGALVITLHEVNDSGFAGAAFLSPATPGGAASDVSLFLIPLAAPMAGMTEDAQGAMMDGTPTAAGEEPAVTAPADGAEAGFATFDLGNPSRVTVAAGEALTIVNTAPEPRGLFVPALNLAVLVEPGETLEVPLATPGEFPAFVLDEAGTVIATGPLFVE